jgi:positive control factor
VEMLILEYKIALRDVERAVRRHKAERIKVYRFAKKKREGHHVIEEQIERPPVTEEERILQSAADSLKYSIQYLNTGREPGTRRGAHRRSREQREIPFDPYWINNHRVPIVAGEPVSEEDRELLDDLLDLLTCHERQAFKLVRGQGQSFSETARLLNVSKGTVQNLVERAERKLKIVVKQENTQVAGIQRTLKFNVFL